MVGLISRKKSNHEIPHTMKPISLAFGLLFLLALVLALLPSCTPTQLEAARKVPFRIGYHTSDGEISYSSKNGLGVDVFGQTPRGVVVTQQK